MRRLVIPAGLAFVAIASGVHAHPKLVSTTPAANATVAKPAHLDLHFSERLVPAFSKADLTMAAMPGMRASNVASAATLAADARTLVVTPKAPLHAGRYSVAWHVVSTDTHKAAGSYAFVVK